MWVLISITVFLSIGYVLYLWQVKKQQRSCTLCQKNNKKEKNKKK